MGQRRVGVAMAGGNPVEGKQQPDGFYSTPEDATWAFLDWLERTGIVPGIVAPETPFHECCCGDGRMAKIISLRHPVIATDLVNRGFGEAHGAACDVTKLKKLRSPVVMTNPPFFLADTMLEVLLAQDFLMVAMLLKTTHFNTKGRIPAFKGIPPAFNLGLTWRPDFRGLGRPTMNCNWFVWLRGNTDLPRYDVLPRPTLPAGIMPKPAPRPKRVKPPAGQLQVFAPGSVELLEAA